MNISLHSKRAVKKPQNMNYYIVLLALRLELAIFLFN